MIIDTHAHLMFPQLFSDFDGVIDRAKKAGVEKIINIGCGAKESREAFEMLSMNDCMYATLGIHPHDCPDLTDALLDQWRGYIAKNERVVAIGECGLDYFRQKISSEDQKVVFAKQLEFASEVNKPVVVHCREAEEDTLEVLNQFDVRAVFHCFAGDVEFLKKVLDRGYMVSFTGIVTFSNASVTHEVVKEVPMDKFMVETDCPFLAPQKYRGEQNEPAYVSEVVREIAELKGISYDEVAESSTVNACNFFGI